MPYVRVCTLNLQQRCQSCKLARCIPCAPRGRAEAVPGGRPIASCPKFGRRPSGPRFCRLADLVGRSNPFPSHPTTSGGRPRTPPRRLATPRPACRASPRPTRPKCDPSRPAQSVFSDVSRRPSPDAPARPPKRRRQSAASRPGRPANSAPSRGGPETAPPASASSSASPAAQMRASSSRPAAAAAASQAWRAPSPTMPT
mmetsp:Transcript_101974/g.273766  ORF Transcript_101974/g.273766 Transcript_101974/m.273766 type:complete len:200 (+) Transcript_101974:35-634(+)